MQVFNAHNASAVDALAVGASSNATDVVARQTDVVERLVGQVTQFVHRAAVADPILSNADRVHGRFLKIIFLMLSCHQR